MFLSRVKYNIRCNRMDTRCDFGMHGIYHPSLKRVGVAKTTYPPITVNMCASNQLKLICHQGVPIVPPIMPPRGSPGPSGSSPVSKVKGVASLSSLFSYRTNTETVYSRTGNKSSTFQTVALPWVLISRSSPDPERWILTRMTS